MKTLNVQDRLEYARCAVAVIRALKILGIKEMRYQQFGRAIGLIADGERWQPWHRQQVEAVLQAAAAIEKQHWGGEDKKIERLEFDRIVTDTGKPGTGIAKSTRLSRKA
jgi:hypothetical protein